MSPRKRRLLKVIGCREFSEVVASNDIEVFGLELKGRRGPGWWLFPQRGKHFLQKQKAHGLVVGPYWLGWNKYPGRQQSLLAARAVLQQLAS